MSESNLNKEFSKRDVQRMRNIITGNTGGSTGVQSGYTKQSQDYQEDDVWEESGKQWTIKNGIKQTITKFDKLKKLVTFPLICPECSNPMKDYEINFNVKQLLLICEYYGISKDIRVNKLKKQDIIEQIILFEKNMENIEITIKRKEMWYYMSELKNDKMMKKFVIW